jgi:hypothetical protein
MLTIQTSIKQQPFRAIYEPQESARQKPFVTFGDVVVTSRMPNDVSVVALRCNAPLDAYELEAKGYQQCYFERDNTVTEDAFVTLGKLGLHTIVYFCDAYGTHFDDERLRRFADAFNVSLCKVYLPFPPFGFSTWDDCQWRIFHERLTKALSAPCQYVKKITEGVAKNDFIQ